MEGVLKNSVKVGQIWNGSLKAAPAGPFQWFGSQIPGRGRLFAFFCCSFLTSGLAWGLRFRLSPKITTGPGAAARFFCAPGFDHGLLP
jgi:hypothetical protein